MSTQNVFEMVSKPFQNGLLKPTPEQVSINRFLSNQFQSAIRWQRRDGYGAIWRHKHCWRFGAKTTSNGNFGELFAMTSCKVGL